MQNITFRLIAKKDILVIIPLLQELNTTTPKEILTERVIEMSSQNYECVGVYFEGELIGISGLWYSTRHYCGKSVEPDHVVISDKYTGKGLGKLLFKWIYEHAKKKGCTTIELNAYTQNRASHKFYCNEGFEIYGFHFLKKF
jgi:GNAT superfamily N-acetyltransferase